MPCDSKNNMNFSLLAPIPYPWPYKNSGSKSSSNQQFFTQSLRLSLDLYTIVSLAYNLIPECLTTSTLSLICNRNMTWQAPKHYPRKHLMWSKLSQKGWFYTTISNPPYEIERDIVEDQLTYENVMWYQVQFRIAVSAPKFVISYQIMYWCFQLCATWKKFTKKMNLVFSLHIIKVWI